jgi:hypothetical protein
MPEFEVFVSWSRPTSHQVAEAFKKWLPEALPDTKPWLSSEDVSKGTPWFSGIAAQLARSRACVICVTPENVGSPWLYYEAGAIAHAMQGSLICPFLLGVKPSELSGTPLGQYHITTFDKEDTWRLIRALNAKLAVPHDEKILQSAFDSLWPEFQEALAQVPTVATTSNRPEAPGEPDLSAEACHVLIETAKDPHGILLMLNSSGGFHLQTHSTQLVDGHDPRVEAAYREAVNDLISRRLLEGNGSNGELFTLTKRGWELADKLPKEGASPPRVATEVTDERAATNRGSDSETDEAFLAAAKATFKDHDALLRRLA